MSGLPYSYPTLIEGAALTLKRIKGKPHTQMEESKKKKVTIYKLGFAASIISITIYQHTVCFMSSNGLGVALL